MLAKKYRLPLGRPAGRPSETLREREYSIKVFPAEHSWGRFGVICGKSVDRTASGRNRIRRAVLRAAAVARASLPVRDYLIVVHPQKGGYPKSHWNGFILQIHTR